MNRDEEISKLKTDISSMQRRLAELVKSKGKKKSKPGKNLINNYHSDNLKDRSKFDFVIEADGGSSCNSPAKGYGMGYGSFQIQTEEGPMEIKRLKFGNGISVNAAEILSISRGLDDVLALLSERDPSEYRVLIRSDSLVALRNVQKCENENYIASGSESFVNSVKRLQEQVLKFERVEAEWRPREHSVTLFGH